MDLVVYDDDEKRYVPWAVALTAALLVALLAAVLTFFLARQASGDDGEQAVTGTTSPAPATAPSEAPTGATEPTAAPAGEATADPACAAALQAADEAVTRAGPVEQSLAEHTAIVDEQLAERISPEQALDQALPVLTEGATARRQLQQAVTAYEQARQSCPAQP